MSKKEKIISEVKNMFRKAIIISRYDPCLPHKMFESFKFLKRNKKVLR